MGENLAMIPRLNAEVDFQDSREYGGLHALILSWTISLKRPVSLLAHVSLINVQCLGGGETLHVLSFEERVSQATWDLVVSSALFQARLCLEN
jgi:hypothetical protein